MDELRYLAAAAAGATIAALLTWAYRSGPGDTTWNCAICGQVFKTRDAGHRHLAQVHRIHDDQ